MKINNPIGFGRLGMSFSSIEDDIIEVSKHMEIEANSLGRLTEFTIDKLRNIGDRIDNKIIDPCIKNVWHDSIPYQMGRGAFGLEQSTIGHLKKYLFNKYNLLILYAHEKGTNIEFQRLHLINDSYIENRRTMIISNKIKDNGACYIATQVYGSYEHPKVLILRNFRDEKLNKSWFGKKFIVYYYFVSPGLVKWLSRNNLLKNTVKMLLDHFVRLLTIKYK